MTAIGKDAGGWTPENEIVCLVRDAAKRVTGGNCTFADDDVGLLAGLAERAIDAGLHEGIITDKVTLFQIEAARAERSARGESAQ